MVPRLCVSSVLMAGLLAAGSQAYGQGADEQTGNRARRVQPTGVIIRVDPTTGATKGKLVRPRLPHDESPSQVGPTVNDYFTVDFPAGGFRCADCGMSCEPGDTRTIESNFLMTDAANPGAEITSLVLGNVSVGGGAGSQVSELLDREPFCSGDPARWDHVVTLDSCTTFTLHYDLFGVVMDTGFDRLYWSDLRTDELLRLATGSPTDPWEQILSTENPLGIALDQSVDGDGGTIYWVERVLSGLGGSVNGILRADLDGSNPEVIVDGLVAPIGVALDLINRKIYWVDHGRDAISRSGLDGSGVEDVLTGLPYPVDIALDVAAETMYWTEHGADRIYRANMNDGSGVIWVEADDDPQGIALDLARGKVYWTETSGSKIQRANLDLSSPEVVIAGGFVDLVGISIDVPEEALYVADYNARRLQRYDVGSGVLTDVRTDVTGPWDVELERAPCSGSMPLTPGDWQPLALPCQSGRLRVMDLTPPSKAGGAQQLRVMRWDAAGAKNIELSAGDELRQGQGYWIHGGEEHQTITLRGVRADSNQLFMIPLRGSAGGDWHLVGHPYDFSVAWSTVKVRHEGRIMSLAEADPVIDGIRACDMEPPDPSCIVSCVAHRPVETGYAVLDGSAPEATARLQPWDAVWVRAYRDATLLIPPLPVTDSASVGPRETRSSLGTTIQSVDGAEGAGPLEPSSETGEGQKRNAPIAASSEVLGPLLPQGF
jgi:hypothetical protein